MRATPDAARNDPAPARFLFLKLGLVLEAGPGGPQFGVAPVLVGLPEVAASAQGDELADPGSVLHAEVGLAFQVVKDLLHLHGAGPLAGALGAGHLVSSSKIALTRTESRRPQFKLN